MDEKIRENRLRRIAERQGLAVQKSRRRDPRALDYGKYRIIDPEINGVVAGASPWNYSMDLDEVEEWLNDYR